MKTEYKVIILTSSIGKNGTRIILEESYLHLPQAEARISWLTVKSSCIYSNGYYIPFNRIDAIYIKDSEGNVISKKS